MNNNDISIKQRIYEFYNNSLSSTAIKSDNFFIDLNENYINIFFINYNNILVYESFPSNKLLIEEKDIYEIINFPNRILEYKNKEEYIEIYNYIKSSN